MTTANPLIGPAASLEALQRTGTHPNTYSSDTICQLNALTSEFYAREAASFSATRETPWRGWTDMWDILTREDPALPTRSLAVLDLGCGNLRFERFLTERVPTPPHVTAFDNCPELTATGSIPSCTLEFQQLDIVETLLSGAFDDQLPNSNCDLAVAFGLMHHLPTFTLRRRVLASLVRALRPDGFAIVSFWQFLNDPRIAAKAEASIAEGRTSRFLPPFEPGDYLLGWQQAHDVYRFCHHTDNSEIDALRAAVQADPDTPAVREIARFTADGKQGNLNCYLVLQRT